MNIIRPASFDDVDGLYELASKTGPGLTTLPQDRQLLEDKIDQSNNAFVDGIAVPGLEYYFFVLEDTTTGTLAGTSALAATVGLDEAFYTYHEGTTVHSSRELGVHNVINTLYLGNDYTGVTEICTLFLDPAFRKDGNGSLLSRSRFMFIALHMKRFAPKIIAELRGVSDENGRSPFWDALGNHFFSMSFLEADALSGEGKNQFIAELMPKYPIYLPLLPEEARKVIGQVHPQTRPALALLQKEGFEYKHYVDIFDAGPTIEVMTQNVTTIKNSQNMLVKVKQQVNRPQNFMVANTFVRDFRCAYINAQIEGNELLICEMDAEHLKVNDGDTIRAYATGK